MLSLHDLMRSRARMALSLSTLAAISGVSAPAASAAVFDTQTASTCRLWSVPATGAPTDAGVTVHPLTTMSLIAQDATAPGQTSVATGASATLQFGAADVKTLAKLGPGFTGAASSWTLATTGLSPALVDLAAATPLDVGSQAFVVASKGATADGDVYAPLSVEVPFDRDVDFVGPFTTTAAVGETATASYRALTLTLGFAKASYQLRCGPSAGAATQVFSVPVVADPPHGALTLSDAAGPEAGGNAVTISGDALDGTTSIKIDGHPIEFENLRNGTLSIIMPAHLPGAAEVSVISGVATRTVAYTYEGVVAVLRPTITKLSTTLGIAGFGGVTTISGANLSSVLSVRIGTKSASFAHSGSNLVVIAPAQPKGTYPVVVRSTAGASQLTAASRYTYYGF